MSTYDRYERMKLNSDREAEEALKRNNAKTLERLQKDLEKKKGPESMTIGELEDSFNRENKDVDKSKEDTKDKKRSRKKKKEEPKEPRNNGKYLRSRDWLLVLLVANVPIIGWIPLVYWIFARRSTPDKVAFAKAMLIYQFILTFISFCILYVGVQLVVIMFEYFLNNIIGSGSGLGV